MMKSLADPENLRILIPALVTLLTLCYGIYQYGNSKQQEFRKKFWEEHYKLYTEAVDAAATIAMASDLESVKESREIFWRLYWGRLSMVEHRLVEGAMKAYGDVLRDYEQKGQLPPEDTIKQEPTDLQLAAYELAHAMRKSLAMTWRPVKLGEIDRTLLRISAATIDRMLTPERRKHELRGRSGTKPGTLLKKQIPIRTFAEWDDQRPGFAEIDLVGHDGGVAAGDYCQTLDLTDIATTWTETEAVPNKAQTWVFEALKNLRKNLPFPLLGIDSDNGSEFINKHLAAYCKLEKLSFTRSRPYRKNDNCFVEQKNYSVVRRAVGYQRYDSPAQLQLLNEIYATLRLYTNFFQPTMKLQFKQRVGSKVTKRYDRAQTPYQRVLASPHIAEAKKELLRVKYATLNPAALKRKITRLQERLLKTTGSAKRVRLRPRQCNNDLYFDNPNSSVAKP